MSDPIDIPITGTIEIDPTTLPPGPPGAVGPAGPTGPTGPVGPQGPAGTLSGETGTLKVHGRVEMHYDAANPYREVQWRDENNVIRGQIITHGHDMSTPPQFHGHMSFYVWDTSYPPDYRHHPLNIFYGTRDPKDPPSEWRNRSRIAFDHAYVDLMDSRLVMQSEPSRIPWEIYVDDAGRLRTRRATAMPEPET